MKLIKLSILILLLIGRQAQAQNDRTITVLSFNILHGATTQGDFDLDAIAQVILDADPDFVALQEVDFKTNRAKKYDLVTELAWRTKMAGVFGKAMDYDGGGYGEGVLTKFDFIASKNHNLPYSNGNEPRAALEVISILPSGDTISFVGTHLDHLRDPTDRVMQAKKLNELFLANRYPTLLVGDLNDTPGSRAISLLETHWQASYDPELTAATYPSNDPTKKIDYVLSYPRKRWKIERTEVRCDPIASDHCAYLVTLTLVTGE